MADPTEVLRKKKSDESYITAMRYSGHFAVMGRRERERDERLASAAPELAQQIIDAVTFMDKTIDNVIDVPDTMWRSDEVIAMLHELSALLVPASQVSGEGDR